MTVKCKYCNNQFSKGNIKRHENACYLNPKNLRECVVCNKPIKDYKKSKGTCSHSCSNIHFASIRNKPENYKNYRTICFYHHDKKCIICGEDNIVEVHHYDENNKNNSPENLVPLCPTHHAYMHSRYKVKIEDEVNEYVENFLKK